jgi:hypothetical protein
MRPAPGKTAGDIVGLFARARAAADQVIADLDLEAAGTAWFGDTVTLRWGGGLPGWIVCGTDWGKVGLSRRSPCGTWRRLLRR